MRITHMTYARVEHGKTVAPGGMQPAGGGLGDFLSDHIVEFREMTRRRGTTPGEFTDPEAQSAFRDLFRGTDEAFLAAAETLAKRLIARMDHRTSPGLLVCLRADDDLAGERCAGVLKLQVMAEHAAVLEHLASGADQLAAVTDLMTTPGQLQKGALSCSWLPAENVLIGDQLWQDAAYFPAAFGISTFARPGAAVGDLMTALDEIAPGLTAPVARELPSVPSGTPAEVLSALGDRVPGLTGDTQADVAAAMEQRARPARSIDTSRPARGTIRFGEITISGPVTELRDRVTIQAGDAGAADWVITVESADEPRWTYP